MNVAILLTTFNGADYLEDQLTSIADQEGVNVSVFAFDDGSEDRTEEILIAWSDALNIKIFRNSINSGGTGKNIFINIRDFSDKEIFDYYAFCDQDDVWCSKKLIRAITCLNSSSSDLYHSDLTMWNPEEGELGMIRKSQKLTKFDHLFNGGSAGCTYVLTNRFFESVKQSLADFPIEKQTRISHDWLVYFIARTKHFKVYADKSSFIKYRIHANSQYGNMNVVNIEAMRKRFNLLRNGFYQTQIDNSSFFLNSSSEEMTIYRNFLKNPITRLLVLFKYNFSLTKTKTKFLKFFILSIFFVPYGTVRTDSRDS